MGARSEGLHRKKAQPNEKKLDLKKNDWGGNPACFWKGEKK